MLSALKNHIYDIEIFSFFNSPVDNEDERGKNRTVANNSLYRVSSGRVQDGLKPFTSEDKRKNKGQK